MVWFLFRWISMVSLMQFPASTKVAEAHPIFVSVTEIEHNAKDKTLEISCKIFTDDFEKTLRKTYPGFIDLINPRDKEAMNKIVNDYIQKHLKISADGKPVSMQFLGYQQQEEGITSFFQVNNIPSVKKMDVFNNILYEYKVQQIGIVHVIVGGNRKSYRLTNPDDKTNFEF